MCIKVLGFALLILSNFLKYPMNMKQFLRPNYFIFIGYFKTEGGRVDSLEPPDPPLDPPMSPSLIKLYDK